MLDCFIESFMSLQWGILSDQTPQVPSTHPPNFEVDPSVQLIPVNGLSRIDRPWKCYTVVGAGKTGLDALLYLLDQVNM